MTLRPLRAIREINHTLSELEQADRRAEETARFELAQSATQYSRRAKEVVENTMSLSAVLMRAGEVEQANRLLAEVEHDVMSEKVVFLDTVEEVRAAKTSRRERMTRLRLARLLATAFLGGSLIMFSAFGVAVANYFSEGNVDRATGATRSSAGAPAHSGHGSKRSSTQRTKSVLASIGGVEVKLSKEQFAEFKRLSQTDDPALRDFLLGFLPADVAEKLEAALAATGTNSLADAAEGKATQTLQRARKVKSGTSAGSTSNGTSSPSDGDGSSAPSGEKKQKSSDKGSGGFGEGSEPEAGCEDSEESEEDRTLTGPVNPHCLPVVGKDGGEGSG